MNEDLKTGYARVVFKSRLISYYIIETIKEDCFLGFDVYENDYGIVKFKDCDSIENCEPDDVPVYE